MPDNPFGDLTFFKTTGHFNGSVMDRLDVWLGNDVVATAIMVIIAVSLCSMFIRIVFVRGLLGFAGIGGGVSSGGGARPAARSSGAVPAAAEAAVEPYMTDAEASAGVDRAIAYASAGRGSSAGGGYMEDRG